MLRLLWASLLSRRGENFALMLLTVLAAASATAAPLYFAEADRQATIAEVEAATPAERSLTVHAPVTGSDIAAMAESMRSKLRAVVSFPGLTEVTGGWTSGAAVVTGKPLVNAPLAARSGYCGHLRIDGACPAAAGEVLISQAMAKELGLRPGDTLAFRIFAVEKDLTLRVTGVYDELAAVDDPFWAGRSALTPYPNRAGNPVFTPEATIVGSGVDSATAYVDLVAERDALSDGDLDEFAEQLKTNIQYGLSVESSNGLRLLTAKVIGARSVLAKTMPTGAIQLLLLCWLVLLLTITYGAVHRRAEGAVSALRGAPMRARFMMSFAPSALILVLFSPVGFGLGLLAAQALPSRLSLIMAGATFVIVLITAAIATWRVNAVTLFEALRDVPPRRGGRVALAAEVVGIAIAVMSVIQALSGEPGGIGVLAPIAVALVVGLISARLVRATAGAAGAASVRRGRLALGLAALQLARRPGADRLVALIVIAIALAGHAFAGWEVARHQIQERALVELGAVRVVTVAQTTRTHLLAAVREADPEGNWAMAAAISGGARSELVAVDTTRLVQVTGKTELAQYLPQLRPATTEALRVNGSVLVLEFVANGEVRRSVEVTAVLTGSDGVPVTATFMVTVAEMPDGQVKSFQAQIPGCTKGDGCRLEWLGFSTSPDGLELKSIAQLTPDRTILTAPAMVSPARWRRELDAEGSSRLTLTESTVAISYTGDLVKYEKPSVKMIVVDGPIPLPVLAAGPDELRHSHELTVHDAFGATDRPVELVGVRPTLPGILDRGIIVDLEAADALSDTTDNDAELQVWLNASAPADVEERLRSVGLIPMRTETASQRAASLDARGAGPGARMQAAAAVIGVLLLLPAIAVVASADRRSRAVELRALRVQGVSESVVVKATGGYGLLVAAAVPIGIATSLLTWRLTLFGESPPVLRFMLAAFAAAAIVLAGSAWRAKRRLARAVGESQ